MHIKKHTHMHVIYIEKERGEGDTHSHGVFVLEGARGLAGEDGGGRWRRRTMTEAHQSAHGGDQVASILFIA